MCYLIVCLTASLHWSIRGLGSCQWLVPDLILYSNLKLKTYIIIGNSGDCLIHPIDLYMDIHDTWHRPIRAIQREPNNLDGYISPPPCHLIKTVVDIMKDKPS